MNRNPRKNIGPERIRATVELQRPSAQPAEPPIVPSTPPADPPAEFGRGKPCWPRNEGEIEIPADPPPGAGDPMPGGMGYIGVAQATCTGVRGPFDMDVLVAGPDTIVFGSAQLSTVQALRLCRLLLLAVRLCEVRREEVRP